MRTKLSQLSKTAFLSCLLLTCVATSALPIASAADCSASVGGEGGVYVHCYSDGPGACGAAAFAAANGSSGAGCVAADYPRED